MIWVTKNHGSRDVLERFDFFHVLFDSKQYVHNNVLVFVNENIKDIFLLMRHITPIVLRVRVS